MSDPLPEGVNEADLVDGPKVVHLPSGRATFVAEAPPPAQSMPAALTQPIPQAAHVNTGPPPPPLPVSGAQAKKDYPAVIEAALDVLSARLIGLISLITACLVWAGVIYDPEFWRIIAAGAFSVFVFLPSMALCWKMGATTGPG
jgi:hypothetical protein